MAAEAPPAPSHILSVVGTRPEAIKMAPVIRALAERGLPQRIILTGQHGGIRALLPDAPISELGFDPAHHSAGELCNRLRDLIGAAIGAAHPALVLVQGDTSSALAGALAARDRRLAIGHVEAGLRTGDPLDPWPEENNRVAIDRIATLLFAPSETARGRLIAEAVPGAIFVTGNSGIDALFAACDAMGSVARDRGARRLILATCHRRESRGARLDGILAALRDIASALPVRILLPLHANPHVSAPIRAALEGVAHIHLAPPLDHKAMVRAMRAAWLVLTDSGGLQEEAPALGTPVLVLRDATERSEPCAGLQLVGSDPARIRAAVAALIEQPALHARMAVPSLPFGDGRAAPRIAAIIADWCAAR